MNIVESLELFFNKITLPKTVKDFASVFQKNGFQLYLVGGAVRDYLMGKDIHDYDFATDAKPQDVILISCDFSASLFDSLHALLLVTRIHHLVERKHYSLRGNGKIRYY